MLTSLKIRSLIYHLTLVALLAWVASEVIIIEYIYSWFFAINIIVFVSFGVDKLFAKFGGSRTPEMTFHTLGLLGGFPAILVGRKFFNHKTSKMGFIIPMWILFFAQILFSVWFFGDLDKTYEDWQKSHEVNNIQETTNEN